ncbi:GNAT family N-acetyltransferase [Magnetospirillum moscoviense]|uniref:GNAT family N-acetyltransferase n=1 Tax=Magnetospirillum moscoviense TaxID=1437059 RepID=UPI0012E873BD|nr:GNAT family N-acetyltransferase [Magnetospirillum moscoviense]MBF0325768.1 GNAT family N-acetyltransferase [Alphaproteobacteria bacterium]
MNATPAIHSPRLDRALARVLPSAQPGSMAKWERVLGPTLWPYLAAALDVPAADGEAWRRLAGQLGQANLPRSALVALFLARQATTDRFVLGDLYCEESMWWRALGLPDAPRLRVARRLYSEPDASETVEESSADGLTTLTRRNAPARFDEYCHACATDEFPQWIDEARTVDLDAVDTPIGAAEDLSFLVLKGGQVAMRLDAWVRGNASVQFGGVPVIFSARGARPDDQLAALAINHLRYLTIWSGADLVMVETAADLDLEPEPLRQWIDSHRTWSRRVDYVQIDLARPEETIFADFRETHRQDTKRGLRLMDVRAWTADDRALIEDYLHLKAMIGRFSFDTIDTIRDSLAAGRTHLWVGYDGATPISAVLTADHGTTTIYSSSVSAPGERRPLSHALVWTAIQDAKARGQKLFDMAPLQIDPAFGTKHAGIALFKRGFARTRLERTWHAVQVR